MNLLIVDDEYYYAEGIKNTLEHSDLFFDAIFCAYSMEQAIEIFRTKSVEILISDIEMPHGSGLELVDWVLNNGYNTETIFLTAYSNFDYALSAIKLQSSDYLLKPIAKEDLIRCVKTVITDYKRKQMQSDWEEVKKNAYQNESNEQFWNSICKSVYQPTQENLIKNIRQYRLQESLLKKQFYVGLLRITLSAEDEQWESKLYDYAIKNVIQETLEPCKGLEAMLRINDQDFFLCMDVAMIGDQSAYLELCHSIITNLKEWLPGNFQLFIGTSSMLDLVGDMFRQLEEIAYHTIHLNRSVISATGFESDSDTTSSLPLSDWTERLLQKKFEEVTASAHLYLAELKKNHAAKRNDLIRFKHDFIQILYAILDKKGESAHILFNDKDTIALFEQSCDSVDTLQVWFDHAMSKFEQLLKVTDASGTTVKQIRQYINNHLDKELSRSELASIAYISPDYLSHVFKEETGESLSSYILASRLKLAKELLITTSHSVSTISVMCGFPNISYFSRQFKRMTGSSPIDFRKEFYV